MPNKMKSLSSDLKKNYFEYKILLGKHFFFCPLLGENSPVLKNSFMQGHSKLSAAESVRRGFTIYILSNFLLHIL